MSAPSPPPRRPIKFDALTRWVLGVLGTAGMGSGGVAVFTQDVEAGPAIMIAIGAFFFVVGIVGIMPTRLKFGDNEAEWQVLTEFVEQTVEDAPTEDRPELLRRLNQLSEAFPDVTSPALSAILYEQSVLEMVREIAHDLRPQITTLSEVGPRARFDMFVTGPTGRKIAIEIRAGRRPAAAYRDVYHRFRQYKDEQGLEHLLIVTADRASDQVKRFVDDLDDASLVQVVGPADMPVLRQEIIRRVGPVEQPGA